LEEGTFILVHSFRGFSPWVADFIVSGPICEAEHHGGRVWQSKAGYLWEPEEESEREWRREGAGTRYTPRYDPRTSSFN
jgi:hypothetical protein